MYPAASISIINFLLKRSHIHMVQSFLVVCSDHLQECLYLSISIRSQQNEYRSVISQCSVELAGQRVGIQKLREEVLDVKQQQQNTVSQAHSILQQMHQTHAQGKYRCTKQMHRVYQTHAPGKYRCTKHMHSLSTDVLNTCIG